MVTGVLVTGVVVTGVVVTGVVVTGVLLTDVLVCCSAGERRLSYKALKGALMIYFYR